MERFLCLEGQPLQWFMKGCSNSSSPEAFQSKMSLYLQVIFKVYWTSFYDLRNPRGHDNIFSPWKYKEIVSWKIWLCSKTLWKSNPNMNFALVSWIMLTSGKQCMFTYGIKWSSFSVFFRTHLFYLYNSSDSYEFQLRTSAHQNEEAVRQNFLLQLFCR